MNAISFVKNCFDINSIKNNNVKEEFITILQSIFDGFKFNNDIKKTDEYLEKECIYNVDSIDKNTILDIINNKMEDRKVRIIDSNKKSKTITALKNDIEYTIRYIYDSKSNIHTICCNLTTSVGVLHRYFGPTYKLDYNANNEYLELNSVYLNDDDKLFTEKHRYLIKGKNIILVSNIKEYDAFKIYAEELENKKYNSKYEEIYFDGKFMLEKNIEEENNYIYTTDKTTCIPSKLTDNIISCNGLVAYENKNNKMNFEGIITCYDSAYINENAIKKFKTMPLYLKERCLINNYNIRKNIKERVNKLVKKK